MKRLIMCLIVIVIAANFGSCVFADENLLVNPGFEKVEPMGWATYGDAVYVTDTYRNGEQSGKTWVWDYGDGLFEQYVDVIPGEKYQASVYILSKWGDAIRDETEAWIQIEWCTEDNVIISDPIKSPSLTAANDTWEYFETPVVIAPPAAAKAKVKVIQRAPNDHIDGACYFDDAKFSLIYSSTHRAGRESSRNRRRGPQITQMDADRQMRMRAV